MAAALRNSIRTLDSTLWDILDLDGERRRAQNPARIQQLADLTRSKRKKTREGFKSLMEHTIIVLGEPLLSLTWWVGGWAWGGAEVSARSLGSVPLSGDAGLCRACTAVQEGQQALSVARLQALLPTHTHTTLPRTAMCRSTNAGVPERGHRRAGIHEHSG